MGAFIDDGASRLLRSNLRDPGVGRIAEKRREFLRNIQRLALCEGGPQTDAHEHQHQSRAVAGTSRRGCRSDRRRRPDLGRPCWTM